MTEPRKTPRGKQVAGLAAMVERFAETYHACASNTADEWEAGRLFEAAKQLRALEAETQELAEALEELYNTTASLRFDAKGRLGWKFVAETSAWKLNTVALVKAEQLVLASHRAKQEVGT